MDKETIKSILLAHGFTIKPGCDDLREYVYKAAFELLELAAPAAQGEPVGWQFYQDGKWWYGDDRIKLHRKNTEAAGMPVRDVYAAPQPAEQRPAPDVAGLMGALGQYFDAMDSIGREGTATSTLIAEAKCDEAEARLRLFLAAYRKQGGGQA